MTKKNKSNTSGAMLAIFAAVLQAVLLYAALLTFAGVLPVPAELSIVFAVFGAACLIGAVAAGSGIRFDAPGQAQKTTELILPPVSIRSKDAPIVSEETSYGHTEYIFGEGNLDKTEFLTAENIKRRKLRLSWNEGESKKTAEAEQFPLLIGRDGSLCAVAIDDTSVSRKHTQINFNIGAFSVSDAGSSNGTFLDGVPVLAETEIRSGQIIKLGRVDVKVEILD